VRTLLSIGYPDLGAEHRRFLAAFKRENSPAARFRVEPHFTLAFACSRVPEDEYAAHVAGVAARTRAIRFVCRYAMLGANDEDDRAYVFLVPEEGFAAIALLHDHLHTGPLAPHLRLDLPYIPHITIGATTDRQRAKDLCDGLNRAGVAVPGTLRALTVCTPQDGVFVALSEHELVA